MIVQTRGGVHLGWHWYPSHLRSEIDAEFDNRKALVGKGYLKGIIGLPANLSGTNKRSNLFKLLLGSRS